MSEVKIVDERPELRRIERQLDVVIGLLRRLLVAQEGLSGVSMGLNACTCFDPAYDDMTARPSCPVHSSIIYMGQ